MSRLALDFEWEDPLAAKGPELRATWARLSMKVGDQVITDIFDKAARGIRESVYLPLYPLAEWLCERWWHLFYEPESSGRGSSESYASRHNLLSVGEGFALPNLTIQPLGATTFLRWLPYSHSDSGIRFLSEGAASSETDQLRHSLSDLIDSVVERLESAGISGSFLQEEWRAIRNAKGPEIEFCKAAAALGIDPYSVDPKTEQEIISSANVLPHSIAAEFFSAVDLHSLWKEAEALGSLLSNQTGLKIDDHLWEARSLIAGLHFHDMLPWEAGYEAARILTEFLSLSKVVNGRLDRLIALLLPNQQSTSTCRLTAHWLDGIARVGTDDDHRYLFYCAKEGPRTRTSFPFCRLAFEYFAAPPNVWRIITRSKTEAQARNRAFAAEFLVPAELLRARVSGGVIDSEELEDLANEFDVSPWVVRHQLENHRVATISSDDISYSSW